MHIRPASVGSGRSFVGNTDEDGRLAGTRDWDSDDDTFEDSSDDEAASAGTRVGADDDAAEAEGQAAEYDQRNECGVPTPLQAGLLTLSGDPMRKWDSLVHLDAIKVWGGSCGVARCSVVEGGLVCGEKRGAPVVSVLALEQR